MNTLRTAGLVLAATLIFPSMAFATTYAAPPPAQDEGYPDARGDYEQSYVTATSTFGAIPPVDPPSSTGCVAATS